MGPGPGPETETVMEDVLDVENTNNGFTEYEKKLFGPGPGPESSHEDESVSDDSEGEDEQTAQSGPLVKNPFGVILASIREICDKNEKNRKKEKRADSEIQELTRTTLLALNQWNLEDLGQRILEFMTQIDHMVDLDPPQKARRVADQSRDLRAPKRAKRNPDNERASNQNLNPDELFQAPKPAK